MAKGRIMNIWEFSPSGTCHTYLVRADNLESAVEMFIKWQEENIESKWPEKIVREKINWSSPIVIE